MTRQEILDAALYLNKLFTGGHAKYFEFIDMSRSGDKHRLFLINCDEQTIEYEWFTSHGSGTGPKEVRPEDMRFSNEPESRCTSRGIYRTETTYFGKHGRSLFLNGIESVNNKAKERHIVQHAAPYVSLNYMDTHKFAGTSWGCITNEPKMNNHIIDCLVGGSIVYVHVFGIDIYNTYRRDK